MDSYSVGIPVRNEANTLVDCVESVLAQTIPPQEILICVNGSKDGSLEIAYGLARNNNVVSVLESNPGKPHAWNKIVDEAKTDNILMIDGDVKINDVGAQNLLKKLEQNPNLTITGGRPAYLKPDKTTIFSFFCNETYKRPLDIFGLMGRMYMMRKEATLDVGEIAGIKLMPPDIMHEDTLLGLISHEQGKFDMADNAYALANPIVSFKDWKKETVRRWNGYKQLREQYPQLSSGYKSTFKIYQNWAKRLIEIDGIHRKCGMTGLLITRTLIGAYMGFKRSDYNNLWDETKSTKVAFNNQG